MKILLCVHVFILLVTCDAQDINGTGHFNNVTDDNGLPTEERTQPGRRPGDPPCAMRLGPALEAMRRQSPSSSRGVLELRGISLHQPLRGSLYDMYVTDIKVKGLGDGYLERCRFSRGNRSLTTKLMFGELLARGTVRIRDTSALGLLDWLLDSMQCNLTLRMRSVPLEVAVSGDPSKRQSPLMSARFLMDLDERTEFRGCEEPLMHRSDDQVPEKRALWRNPELVHAMEMAFVSGMRELMGLFMERQLRHSMTDVLMSYLGYTTSYG